MHNVLLLLRITKSIIANQFISKNPLQSASNERKRWLHGQYLQENLIKFGIQSTLRSRWVGKIIARKSICISIQFVCWQSF